MRLLVGRAVAEHGPNCPGDCTCLQNMPTSPEWMEHCAFGIRPTYMVRYGIISGILGATSDPQRRFTGDRATAAASRRPVRRMKLYVRKLQMGICQWHGKMPCPFPRLPPSDLAGHGLRAGCCFVRQWASRPAGHGAGRGLLFRVGGRTCLHWQWQLQLDACLLLQQCIHAIPMIAAAAFIYSQSCNLKLRNTGMYELSAPGSVPNHVCAVTVCCASVSLCVYVHYLTSHLSG